MKCPGISLLRHKKGSHSLPLENPAADSKCPRVKIFVVQKKCEYSSLIFPCAGEGQILLFHLTLMRRVRAAI